MSFSMTIARFSLSAAFAAGGLFALFLVLFPGTFPCSGGCGLTESFVLGGVSLVHVAVVGYPVAALVLFYRPVLIRHACWLLVFDIFLLGLLLYLRLPCSKCLLLALPLAALLPFCLDPRWKRVGHVWATVFVMSCVMLLYPAPDFDASPRHVWLSPSCPHCLQALEQYRGDAELHWVCEKSGDRERVRALGYVPPSPLEELRNRAVVFAYGGRVPLVMTRGVPAESGKNFSTCDGGCDQASSIAIPFDWEK